MAEIKLAEGSIFRRRYRQKYFMKFNKICVLHLNQIGDLVFSLPLLRALRENFPAATIHSIIRPNLQDLLDDSPYIDKLFLRKNGFKNTLKLLKQIRQNEYDLLISLSGSDECSFLTAFSKAKVKAGFACFPWNYNSDIKEKVEGHPGWYNNYKILKKLKIEVEKRDYVGLVHLPFPKDISRELPGQGDFNYEKKFAVISPGTSARRKIKAWEDRKFGNLIIALKNRYDLNSVLVGGKEDWETNNNITNIMKEKGHNNAGNFLLNLAGEIGLRKLCYLLKKASLFVGIDSGVMHLASSFNIPVVGIFGPTDPFYVGPQNEKHIVVQKEGMECIPCYLKGCPEIACMKNLEVSQVLNACEQLLSGDNIIIACSTDIRRKVR